ncbi:MAG TPA: prepilin-type N-terminal cleavage/methylation domain-containing protein [Verrucomicrobiae bacterium]|jgi:prepilin-type N-terminal cleavage/methylation domain-containing protein|nr:prepilin-type N-terminal cleavage/methylation domain-containing protein [Verrucomicrobiae bacterium]
MTPTKAKSASRLNKGGRFRSDAGFSLVELLVVLALLIILTVMGTSRFSASARRKGLAACQLNLQKVYLALSIYRSDNGAFPSSKDASKSEEPLSLLIPKSTTTTEIFICPGSRDDALPEGVRFTDRRISYAYYMDQATNTDPPEILVTDWQINTAPKHRGQPVFSLDGKKPGNNHYGSGGNLLSIDGNIASSPAKASRDLLFSPPVTLLNP